MNYSNYPFMKYFCLHHIPLVDRKSYLQERFSTLKLKIEWITDFLPETLFFPTNSYFDTIEEYSLFLKHRYCFQQQVSEKIEYMLVLEDDVLLPDNFNDYVVECMKEFKEMKGDILFLGTCCNIAPSQFFPNKKVYWEPGFSTRCTHCYVSTLATAQKMLKYFDISPIKPSTKIASIIEIEKLKSCYAEPGIQQGSLTNRYRGTLNNWQFTEGKSPTLSKTYMHGPCILL